MNRKIVKYGAPWCGPCKMQNAILEELHKNFPEVDIEYIDIDSEEGEISAEKHGIMGVPSIIIYDEDGDESKRFVGLTQKVALLDALHITK
jgi:thioredoxin 1